MRYNLEGFKESKEIQTSLHSEFQLSLEDAYGSDLRVQGPISMTAELYRVEKEIVFYGKLSFTTTEHCTRCLDSIQVEFKTEFHAKIVVEDLMDDSEEYCLLYQDGELAIEELIQEVVRIEYPLQHICGLECKGLCPRCGVNLNHESCQCENDEIDPRLEKLKNLFK
jgi:uncharacterized protein